MKVSWGGGCEREVPFIYHLWPRVSVKQPASVVESRRYTATIFKITVIGALLRSQKDINKFIALTYTLGVGIRRLFAKSRVYSGKHVRDLWSGVLSFNKKECLITGQLEQWKLAFLCNSARKKYFLFPKTRFTSEKMFTTQLLKREKARRLP